MFYIILISFKENNLKIKKPLHYCRGFMKKKEL